MKKAVAYFGSLFSLTRNTRRVGFAPYTDKAANRIYNLLFCDKPDLFRKALKAAPEGVWSSLLAEKTEAASLKAITEDVSQDSRARLLGFHRLRELGETVAAGELLGVVVEVKLPDGLDVLAAYVDGGVHYIHHREAMFAFEPSPPEWRPTVERLLVASRAAVEQIGPWQQLRIAPPTEGMIRMSFLVSDGLYFGQGLLNVMDKDELAAPIIAASTQLLKFVTSAASS